VHVFRGVPYAAPPTGARRFRPPAAPAAWKGIRPASRWPRSCPQEQREDFAPLRWYRSTLPQSEDCLYLNVFTPAPDGAGRPVMVWFHGGAFCTGAATAPGFEGSALARSGDVVVVTVNHRLNVFGHFHPGPAAGESFADSANAGLLDLVAALGWVRDNIAGFGGDPGCVTIFGESGGGGKVGRLMGMPQAQGLFHRAILQSSGLRSVTPAQGEAAAAHLLAQFDLTPDRAEALRDVPAADLLAARMRTVEAQGHDAFEPLPDGRALPEAPFETRAPALSAEIPMMIGTCENEALYRLVDLPGIHDITRAGGHRPPLQGQRHGRGARHPGLRPLCGKPANASPFDVYADILTDQRFRMNTLRAAALRAEAGQAPTYLYRFNLEEPGARTGSSGASTRSRSPSSSARWTPHGRGAARHRARARDAASDRHGRLGRLRPHRRSEPRPAAPLGSLRQRHHDTMLLDLAPRCVPEPPGRSCARWPGTGCRRLPQGDVTAPPSEKAAASHV
jgi:para-nitrobenzyl esterase